MSGPVAEGMSHGCEDDVTLVVRTLAGDRAAFGTLVERHQEPVRRVTRAVLHDVHDADDAAQDTFLTALLKLDRYDRRRPFRPWLLRIATNTAIDRRRRRALRRTAPLALDVSTSDPGPDVATERAALQERLRAALNELPERYRIAIVLFDVEGFAHAEIAEILGVAVGTVRSAVFHARRHLRELLADWKE